FLSIKVIPTFVIGESNKIHNRFAKSLIVGELFNLSYYHWGFGITMPSGRYGIMLFTAKTHILHNRSEETHSSSG
ncbi:MAG: hypothetical protein LBJ80_01980, partial [Rickettsiales bacterium]|nr:hypothetical protein [Rickettsiales bacterium]MDR1261172.1 hypothetical protein [Rickettsiales bacterium]